MSIITTEKAQILYDAALVDQPGDHLFEPEAWRARGGLDPVTAGRGSAWFVHDDQRRMVLRHYRRGGAMARLAHDTYLWTGLERTRPWREFQLLAQMHQQGLPVPPPVAARVVRNGFVYRGDLLTVRLDARALSSLARERGDLPWQAIGRCIRRFHAAGVYHADLNAHNILLDAADNPYVIDFDRGCLRRAGAWQQQNLVRLRRSLDKLQRLQADFIFSEADWDALMRGYKVRD